MPTKIEVLELTFDELRINGLTSNPSPEMVVAAIRRMDAMVNAWKNFNLCLGYNDSDATEGIDPNQDSGLDDRDVMAVAINLAVQLSPSYGSAKPVTPETKAAAKLAYEGLFSPEPVKREGTPYQPLGSGSGYRYWHGRSGYCAPDFQRHIENTPSDCDNLSIKVGQTKNYTLDLTQYIPDGDVIASFDSESSGGVSIDDISEVDGIFTLKLTGNRSVKSSITITLTLDPSEEVNPVKIYVDVIEQ